jgi:acyl-CoA thioester hydrolase
MRFFEAARAEAFRASGANYMMLVEQGLSLPVVEAHLRFHKPAVYDDLIAAFVAIAELGRSKIAFDYELRRDSDGCLLATGTTVHGCLDVANNRLTRIPDWARSRLCALQSTD